MNPKASQVLPFEQEWPIDDLETLGHCPVCGSPERELMYSRLRDIVFGTAPGQWTLYRCRGCDCAYLDPRPTRDTIGLAYQGYFTHAGTGREADERLSWSQRWARKLANGYRNWYYGTQETPAHWLGVLVARLSPGFRYDIQRSFRCLQPQDQGKRVLDVGCGGGNFMYWARAMGCQVSGTDPDPVSVRNARALGFDVREGGIEEFAGDHHAFDIITFGHVIEHLHDPVAALKVARQLLRPDGTLWLETPNIDSRYHKKYKYLWRGLDLPRHLVLFSWRGIEIALEKAGFDSNIHKFDGEGEMLKTSKKLDELNSRANKIQSDIIINRLQFNEELIYESDVLRVVATK